MIVTLTANPSLDRTVALSGPLERGAVQRALAVTTEPGGKGVNVARVVSAAGQLSVAVLPGAHDDPLVLALRDSGLTHRAVPVPGHARANLTLSEPDGTTTKVNEPGGPLDAAVLEALTEVLVREAAGARWAVLAGSLPPGVPDDWYAELCVRLAATGASVAVDTSGDPCAPCSPGRPCRRCSSPTPRSSPRRPAPRPTSSTTSAPPSRRRRRWSTAAWGPSWPPSARGAPCSSTPDGAWTATPPRVRPRSTVGAGDAALAGYLLADLTGAGPADRLRSAVAHGAAAVPCPAPPCPSPHDLAPDLVVVRPSRPLVGGTA